MVFTFLTAGEGLQHKRGAERCSVDPAPLVDFRNQIKVPVDYTAWESALDVPNDTIDLVPWEVLVDEHNMVMLPL